MSKISLKPNSAGTANFEIAAPATNTDRTFTLPDEDGTLATAENIPSGYTDSDALNLFNATGSAPVYACRSWVVFNGTSTPSVLASGNVSSISDLGTGQYRVNFISAMPTAEFCVVGICINEGVETTYFSGDSDGKSTSRTGRFFTVSSSGSNVDSNRILVSVFG